MWGGVVMNPLSAEPKFLTTMPQQDDDDGPFDDFLPDHERERLRRDGKLDISDSIVNLRHTDPERWLRIVRRGPNFRKPRPKKPPKVETPKTVYDRKRAKQEAQREVENEEKKWGDIWK